jgi:hypothetical protein
VLAVVTGGVIGAVVAYQLWPDRTPPPHEPSNAAQTAALLRAVERSQQATYTAEGTFTRRMGGSVKVTDPEIVVRRPPDRMTYSFGTWSGVVGGRAVQCERDGRHGAFTSCGSPPGRSSSVDDDEAARLRQLVGGDQPVYRARDLGGGCFQLRLIENVALVPEYGTRAVLCFDPDVGAPTSRRIERSDGTDVTTYRHVTAEVDPRDLAVG